MIEHAALPEIKPIWRLSGDTFTLPGFNHDPLTLFKNFAYSGKIDRADEDGSAEDPEWQHLLDAWLTGVRLQCPSFMDAVSDVLVSKLPGGTFNGSLSAELLAAAGPRSPMRELLVEIVAFKWTEKSFKSKNMQFNDADIFRKALVRMGESKSWHGSKKKAQLEKQLDCSYHSHGMHGELCYRKMR
ncbi:hypothetical protein LTR95_009165 [Oleoguttula sp. CCFEE 5521]